ncbi:MULTISPECIES: hypothetical protein [Actinomycetes]|uniref:Uncharacterized protein n=1 Tax=Parafrankia colletiae TaxID=573497 RepID=A0A1S1QZT2_9ACTN|nr:MULTISPECIES: hypothetical protein [Actinomycetes]MCK9901286.1 hypothetical protein [Frankia sp. Cpl3]OHV40203.1 hypothetical protein CC117_33635 [Parafrankia colletiae]TLK47464.1 hypothetical protein FDN03_15770 [Glutamicibacter sp. V16R2B1]
MSLTFPESYGELEVLAHYGATADELARRLAERERMGEMERWQLDVQARAHVAPTIDDHRQRWGRDRRPAEPESKTPPTVDDSDDSGEDVDLDEVPRGAMPDVLNWVEASPERARAAIAVEEARDDPRTSLLTKLRKIVDG